MRPEVHVAFQDELRLARQTRASGDPNGAWRHLERAHILSQAHALPHVLVHGYMLAHGWRQRDVRELFGQLLRILVAAPGSWLGKAPLGNTGGVDIGLLTPLPLPEDLRALLGR